MGRCYEFGVSIRAGCEHAMVVTAEGGACECVQCGDRCPGQFAGCAEIVAVAGRRPPLAPPWALTPVAAAAPAATPDTVTEDAADAAPTLPTGDGTGTTLAEVRELLQKVLAHTEEIAGVRIVLDSMASVAYRDNVASAIDRLTISHSSLRSELRELLRRLDNLPG